jgi:hypothetical protein
MIRTFTLAIIAALLTGFLLMTAYLSWKYGSYQQSYPLDVPEDVEPEPIPI